MLSLEGLSLKTWQWMWVKTEGSPTNFDRRDAEYLNENCKGIWTRKFVTVEWQARSPDLHMSDFSSAVT